MNVLIILVGIFAISVLFVGGTQGMYILLGLFINLGIFFLLLFGYHQKWPILVLSIIGFLLIAVVILFFINGYNLKMRAAFASILIFLFCFLLLIPITDFLAIQGFTSIELEELSGLDKTLAIDFRLLARSLLLISLSGAVLDASVAISSGTFEVYQANPHLSFNQLRHASFAIAKKILASTVMTLLFAFMGSSLALILWFIDLDIPFQQIINEKSFVLEYTMAILTTLAALLVLPLTCVTTAYLFTKKKEHLKMEYKLQLKSYDIFTESVHNMDVRKSLQTILLKEAISMKERERILDLVKKGILSTEEGLDLLESMATEKDEKQIKKEADKVTASHKEKDQASQLIDELENGEERISEPVDPKEKERQDQENLEKILDELATEANKTSARLDEVNAQFADNKAARNEKQEALMQLNTKEELGELTEEELAQRQTLEAEIKELEATGDTLLEEQLKLEAELKDIRKNQWSEKKETFTDKFELPDDWKDQATDTLNQVGEKMSEAGSQLGKFLKKTFQTVSETVNDNMEWKDVSLRVPGIATTKFEHEFYYEAPAASILDIKVANGNVTLKTWDSDDVKVEAKIKLYGKMGAEPFEAFSERSQIEVNEDHISFQIPNKRVRADLVFYLPKRVYDHAAIKLLNGNIMIETLEAKDIYTKSTNGNIIVNQLTATMLEVEGVNGNIDIRNGNILDSIIETVNGTVTFGATPENLSVSLVNGDVRLTIKEDNLKKVEASSVNGNVKVALPDTIGLEGHAKTSLGSINSRLSNYEVVREKKERTNQMLQFRRVSDDEIAQVQLSTTTGSIYLKDTDK